MMRSSRHCRKTTVPTQRVSGFTLLELLVGIALFALLSTLVLGGIRLGVRSWEVTADRSAEHEQIRIVHRLLRRQLTDSLALAASSTGRWLLQFEGDSKSLRFVTEFPTYVVRGGAQTVTLTEENQGKSKQLLLRWWPLHAPEDAPPQDEVVLVPDLSNFEITYFGSIDGKALPQWRDRWSEMRILPQLVRIRISGPSGDSWPPLVVSLKVDAVRFYHSSPERPRRDDDVGADVEQAAIRTVHREAHS